jgi:hypothetical protein
VGREIQFPSPHLGRVQSTLESLAALAQLHLGLHPVCDVVEGPDHAPGLARLVAHDFTAPRHPADLVRVGPNDPILGVANDLLERPVRFRQHPVSVLGMHHRDGRAQADRPLGRQAPEAAHDVGRPEFVGDQVPLIGADPARFLGDAQARLALPERRLRALGVGHVAALDEDAGHRAARIDDRLVDEVDEALVGR